MYEKTSEYCPVMEHGHSETLRMKHQNLLVTDDLQEMLIGLAVGVAEEVIISNEHLSSY